MAFSAQVRSDEQEIMDDLLCAGEVVDQTLRELETINTLLGGNAVTISGIDQYLSQIPKDQEVSIADIGCGGGDILRLIVKRARKQGRPIRCVGIDANPHIIAFAERQSEDYPEISYSSLNIFSEDFKAQQFDLVLATLFFHHFTDEQLATFIAQLQQQVRLGIVVNDLHRHWLAYHSIRLLTRYFSKSAMVQNDAAVSVARSFVRQDWQKILQLAGTNRYQLRWRWAFRWQLLIEPAGKITDSLS